MISYPLSCKVNKNVNIELNMLHETVVVESEPEFNKRWDINRFGKKTHGVHTEFSVKNAEGETRFVRMVDKVRVKKGETLTLWAHKNNRNNSLTVTYLYRHDSKLLHRLSAKEEDTFLSGLLSEGSEQLYKERYDDKMMFSLLHPYYIFAIFCVVTFFGLLRDVPTEIVLQYLAGFIGIFYTAKFLYKSSPLSLIGKHKRLGKQLYKKLIEHSTDAYVELEAATEKQ